MTNGRSEEMRGFREADLAAMWDDLRGTPARSFA